jgi:hypothetical protein
MEADDEFVVLAWKHLRELQENKCAPASNAIVTMPSTGAGVGSAATSATVMGDHLCGPTCPHVVLDDTGFWTCSKSGLIFSSQLSNGSFDRNRFMDDVFVPTPRARSKRTWNADDFYPNMIAACSQALNQLLTAEKRELVEKTKLDKARKAAWRTAAAEVELLLSPEISHSHCIMASLNKIFGDFEKLGGNPVHHVIPNRREVLRLVM